MSKLFSSKRFILKPIKQTISNDYINQSMQNIIDPYSKENPNIANNFSTYNPNNITMEYPRHYSPPGKSFQSLPPIKSKERKSNNSQKKVGKTLTNSNSSKNLYSQVLLGPGNKKSLERGKTQVNIMENDLQNNKSELNSIEELDDLNTGTSVNKMNNGVTQINNITNINIHIYQSNANNENQNPNSNKTIENIDKNELIPKNSPMITEFNNYQNGSNNINNINNSFQNSLFKTKQTSSSNSFSSSLIGNAGLSIMNTNNSNFHQKRVNNISTI